MKTKSLLIAAATLAAGIISSQAAVYSQNVVGYYNVTVPAGKFALLGNQLQNADGTNGLMNVFGNGSLVSQSTILYSWNGSSLVPYTFYSVADASPSPAGFYDGDGNLAPFNATNGIGYFFLNPSGSAVTMTVVGTVIQGTNAVTSIPLGFSPHSASVPVVTNINNSSIGLAPDSASQNINYYHWNATSQGYDPVLTYYSAADASPSPAGWYDGDGNMQPWSAPAVGDGFFINNSSGGVINWTNTFSIQ
jgi:hypothetical protein